MKLKDLYQYSNYNCRIGKQGSRDLAKIDPSAQLFILHDGKIYGNHGSKKFSSKAGALGLEEPQGTSQITLFTRDDARAKPLITFKDRELLMKSTCGSKVRVFFKQSAWREGEI